MRTTTDLKLAKEQTHIHTVFDKYLYSGPTQTSTVYQQHSNEPIASSWSVLTTKLNQCWENMEQKQWGVWIMRSHWAKERQIYLSYRVYIHTYNTISGIQVHAHGLST